MSVRISLTLEASEMFLSLHMIFSLERAAVIWAILERTSGSDPSLEMIAPISTASSLWPFILISLWKPFGLFVITFVLAGPISISYLLDRSELTKKPNHKIREKALLLTPKTKRHGLRTPGILGHASSLWVTWVLHTFGLQRVSQAQSAYHNGKHINQVRITVMKQSWDNTDSQS